MTWRHFKSRWAINLNLLFSIQKNLAWIRLLGEMESCSAIDYFQGCFIIREGKTTTATDNGLYSVSGCMGLPFMYVNTEEKRMKPCRFIVCDEWLQLVFLTMLENRVSSPLYDFSKCVSSAWVATHKLNI